MEYNHEEIQAKILVSRIEKWWDGLVYGKGS
jgi:hypothetical protein